MNWIIFSFASYFLFSPKPILSLSIPCSGLWIADLHGIKHQTFLPFLRFGSVNALAGSRKMGGERIYSISSLLLCFGGILTMAVTP